MIILTIALVISVAVNVLLGWYVSKLLQKIRTFTDGIFDIVEKLQAKMSKTATCNFHSASKKRRTLQEARIINSFNSHCKAQLRLD